MRFLNKINFVLHYTNSLKTPFFLQSFTNIYIGLIQITSLPITQIYIIHFFNYKYLKKKKRNKTQQMNEEYKR